ncbi:MAG: Ig-like domain-containing protein [Ignavibacteriae bacterium]|nr:Ig-like domain-containing protein [Ignavibacteriota bacterium]
MKKAFIFLLMLSVQIFSQNFKVISHRGGAALAPENTLAAFEKAVEVGAHYFELDVRKSSDDSLIIMHDASIDRTSDGTGNVSALTFQQLREFDAGSWFGAEFAGEKIPLLSEALDIAISAPYDIGVVIEIKSTESDIVDKVLEIVHRKNLDNRVIISSFTFSQVSRSKTLAPDIEAQLFASPFSETMINNLANIGAEWVGTGSDLSAQLLELAHSKNLKVNRWTVNSANTIKTLIESGYDAVTTDNPIIAIAAMDSTAPSNVILEDAEVLGTKVKLVWTQATDLESGVSHYEIFRSSNPDASEIIATVKNELFYIDETLQEEATFYYRIKAVNFAGIKSEIFSNEIMITTGSDKKAPKVNKISSYGLNNKIIIEFNERVDKTTAEKIANYSINNGINVTNAVLSVDSSSILLLTSEMMDGTEYEISLINIADLATIQNVISDTLKFKFIHKNYLSDLIGAWDFEEGTGTTAYDYSANLNNGTFNGGIEWASGITANGIKFNGTDSYVNIPASSSLNINGSAVTISVWTKLVYLPADLPGAFGPIYDSETDQYVIYEDKANNELRFKVSTSGGAERPGIPAAQLETDEWIHIVGVYDGANAMVYLNGQLMDTHPLTGTVNTGQVANIGKSGDSYFQGSIDNVQVFAKALTQEEINYLHTEFVHIFIDYDSPEISSVSSAGANNIVFVNFNEEVDKLSAENTTNYNIDNGISVNSAQITIDGKSVILKTSELLENKTYNLTVNEVKDLADIPNTILENSTKTFSHKTFPSGLVSYWSFDEGEDTLANDWTNTNTAFLNNNPEWTIGKTGNALKFDAVDDFVEVPNSESLNIDTNGVTVSAWVILNVLPADMVYPYGPVYDSPTDNYVIYADKGNKELRFKVTTFNGAERPGIPADSLKTGVWHNVTGVYDGVHAKIYLDGKLMDTHNLTGNVKPGQIAHIGQDGTSYFNGTIDNVQVYNKGLSEQEVKFLYSGIKTSTLSVANIDETIVNLTWNDVHDPLMGIYAYEVYRDTTEFPNKLLAVVKDTTGYSDQTRVELTSFYYRIRALDAAKNPYPYFSNDVLVTTEADETAPKILSVRTTGENDKLYINFDEKLEENSATTVSNYSVNGIEINQAELSADHKNVILTLNQFTSEGNYTLNLNNIKDVSLAGNIIESNLQKNFNFSNYLQGLVSYWKLDETEDTTAIDLVGTNNGKIVNSPLINDGQFGNAIFFDGVDDYIEIPNSTSLDIAVEGVTLSAWVNLSFLPTEMPTGIGPIYDAPQDSYVFYEDKGNKELRFKVTTANGAERPGIPEAELIKGEWINIVGVYDGTQAMIYMNGELKDTHPNITGIVKAGQVARIGQDGTHYFNGLIDNVQIYNRGLTAEEVKSLFNGDLLTDIESEKEIPIIYSLEQNYPNPFNPTTKIRFSLPQKSEVTLEVFNVIGEKVDELINTTLNSGLHEVEFKNENLSSGIYFYKLKSGNFVEIKKMVLLK